MRLFTAVLAVVCLIGFGWLWLNLDIDGTLAKLIVVGVLGLAWSGIVFAVGGLVATVLGIGKVIKG